VSGTKAKGGGLKAIIAAAEDVPFEDVEVPEWSGATVRIRGLTGTERDDYEAKSAAVRQSKGRAEIEMRLANYRSKLLVKCLLDPENNERVYTDNEAPELGKKAGVVVNRLFELAVRLSGMDDKALEAAEGNSGAAQSGSSTTD
jgi:hypothetical protein